jgi:predicted ArsR family transcriptional regulator
VTDATTLGVPVDEALREAARDFGRAVGAGFGNVDAAAHPDNDDEFARVLAVLAAYGYEPHRDGETITLGSCPFHALAEDHRELVCGMNLEVIAGVLEGAAAADLAARLHAAPGRCCVTVQEVTGNG